MTHRSDDVHELLQYLKQGAPRLRDVFTEEGVTYVHLEYEDREEETLHPGRPRRKDVELDAFAALAEYADTYTVPEAARSSLTTLSRDAAAMIEHFTMFHTDLQESDRFPDPGRSLDEVMSDSAVDQVREYCDAIAFDDVKTVTHTDENDIAPDDVADALRYKEEINDNGE